MGTRSLTCVYLDNEYKVAQYGQFDGYPDGKGIELLEFIKSILYDGKDSFLEKLRQCSWITEDETKQMTAADLKNEYPAVYLDGGRDVLEAINEGRAKKLRNALPFAADSLMCEWGYVIDFDKNVFEVYRGFNDSKELNPVHDRFAFLKEFERENYHGIKIVKSWSLDSLPSNEDFLREFKD